MILGMALLTSRRTPVRNTAVLSNPHSCSPVIQIGIGLLHCTLRYFDAFSLPIFYLCWMIMASFLDNVSIANFSNLCFRFHRQVCMIRTVVERVVLNKRFRYLS